VCPCRNNVEITGMLPVVTDKAIENKVVTVDIPVTKKQIGKCRRLHLLENK